MHFVATKPSGKTFVRVISAGSLSGTTCCVLHWRKLTIAICLHNPKRRGIERSQVCSPMCPLQTLWLWRPATSYEGLMSNWCGSYPTRQRPVAKLQSLQINPVQLHVDWMNNQAVFCCGVIWSAVQVMALQPVKKHNAGGMAVAGHNYVAQDQIW